MDKQQVETRKALRLRAMTGKKLRTCYFCLRYHRGNFKKALELCSGDGAEEGGRRS
jgi:hypothetical protein